MAACLRGSGPIPVRGRRTNRRLPRPARSRAFAGSAVLATALLAPGSFAAAPLPALNIDRNTITVANIGDTSHTFTTDDEAIDETIGPGEEIEIEIAGVSSQDFRCDFHSQMQGTLTVE